MSAPQDPLRALERLFSQRPDEGPFAAVFDEWLLQLGEFTATNRVAITSALRALPTEPQPPIDVERLRMALEAMWPHHTEGIGSSPPSSGDYSYEVWEPFLPGSPDSVAAALAARLRAAPPGPAAPPGAE